MSAFQEQVSGDHYLKMAIQPAEYCHKNGLGKLEGDVVAYVSRYKAKGGVEDLKKARHTLDMLIEMEEAKSVVVRADEPDTRECEACEGEGLQPGTRTICKKCFGSGVVAVRVEDVDPQDRR